MRVQQFDALLATLTVFCLGFSRATINVAHSALFSERCSTTSTSDRCCDARSVALIPNLIGGGVLMGRLVKTSSAYTALSALKW